MRINKSIPKPLRIVLIFFLSLWIIPVVWLVVYGAGLWIDHIRLSQFGDVTQGVVVDTDNIYRRNRRYFITYEYSPKAGAEILTQEAEVSKTIFEKTPIGASVLVRYLPSDPEISNLEGNDLLKITGLGMAMILSPMVLFTGLLIGGVYLSRRLGKF